MFQMCTKYDIYFKTILDSSLIQRQFCFKPIPDISYSSNKISKQNFFFLGHNYKYLEKKTQQNLIKFQNATPGEQKGKAIVNSVQQSLNLIL